MPNKQKLYYERVGPNAVKVIYRSSKDQTEVLARVIPQEKYEEICKHTNNSSQKLDKQK